MITETVGQPSPGTYSDGAAGTLRRWDGHVWTDEVIADPSVTALPPWKRQPFALFGHRWFQVAAGGFLLGLILAVAANQTKAVWLGWAAGVGTLTVGVGFVMLAWQRLQLGEVVSVRAIVGWGLLGGVVGIVVAMAVEGPLSRALHLSGDSPLATFGAGLAEEFGKLLVPVILYFVGRYRDPRAGFAIALGSGTAFGIIEGINFTGLASDTSTPGAVIVMAAQRPLIELLHPILTGFVAAVAWRAARRRGHFFTGAAIGAFVIAVVVHTGNDLIGIANELVGYVAAPVIIIGSYYLGYRRQSKQLVPPDAVAVNPPGWRPSPPRPGST